MRERGFAQNTESHLDDFITQAQHVLDNLTDQHGILKVRVALYELKVET